MKLLVFFAVLFSESLVDMNREVSSWTEILDNPIFARFMTMATGGRLEVLSSPECLHHHRPNLRRLLRQLPFPVRTTSELGRCNHEGYCHDITLQATSLLLVWCERNDMSKEILGLPYRNFVALLSDEVNADILTGGDSSPFRGSDYEYLQHRGVYAIFRNGTKITLAQGSQVDCLSCSQSPLLKMRPPRLLEQLSLNTAQLEIVCIYPVFCEHPTHSVLLKVLRHKNTSFHEKQYTLRHWRRAATSPKYINRIDRVVLTIALIPTWNLGFPMRIRPLCYLTVAYRMYAKRRYPLPKEIVLILPFSWHVWIALLCGMLLSVFVICAMLRASEKHLASVHFVLFALVASMLQQNDQLSSRQQKYFSARLLLAFWCVMGLVLATGYKGSLTSLLRDVPLEAEHPTFPSENSNFNQGYILHQFQFPELRNNTSNETFAGMVRTKYLRLRKRYTIPDKKYFPMVDMFMGRHASTLQNELAKFDCVPTGEPLFPRAEGPLIMYAWQYRKAFTDSIVQAQESGLFNRAEKLQEFEEKYRLYSLQVPQAPEVLTSSDLGPFFLVWSAGIGAAVLVFLLEVLAAYLSTSSTKGRPRKGSIPERDLTQRWACRTDTSFIVPESQRLAV